MGVGSGISLVILLLYISQPIFLKQLDLKLYDAYLRNLDPGIPSSIPVLIDIDERSLTRYGQWPWPRYRLASLIDRLGQAGVSAVAVDILLAEADRTSPVKLHDQLKRDFGLDIVFQGLPQEIEDNDAVFSHVLGRNPVVLGCYFLFDEASASPSFPLQGPGIAEIKAPGTGPGIESLPAATSVSIPLPAFSERSSVAFFNISPDMDGLIRRVPLLLSYDGNIHAGLALQALMLASGEKTLVLHTRQDGIHSIRLGHHHIPVASDGTLPLLFRNSDHTFPYFSADDILQGTVQRELLENRIAFIGTSAAGLKDIHSTPLKAHYAGVEVHAAVVDAILSRRFITLPPWTPGIQALGILLTGLFCILTLGWMRAFAFIPLAGGIAAGFWYAGLILFRHGLFISPLYPLITIGSEALILVSLRFWQEEHQKRNIHRVFSRYVAPEVVNRILDSGRADIALAGENRTISILFSDIRGFTSLSERLTPEQVVALLNSYFKPMTTIVRKNQGTLDKFIGDALMAFWNAPLDVPDHASLSIKTALEMQKALAMLNTKLQQEYGFHLSIGTGIHTGKAFVGNMGTDELLSYTAIGDNINLASRLEGLCPVYGVSVLVSGETRIECGSDYLWQRLDRVRVKGRAQPVEIFTPLNRDEAETLRQDLTDHDHALATYDAGQFQEALTAFSALEKSSPHPLYALYVKRCAELITAPPKTWDGVWTFHSK
jgi:adenylate cyclase